MPALLAPLFTFLGGAFMSLFQFFGSYLGRRLAATAATITLLISIWAGFAAYISSGLDVLIYWLDPGVVRFGLELLPYNTGTVIGFILTTYFAEFSFHQFRRVVDIKGMNY